MEVLLATASHCPIQESELPRAVNLLVLRWPCYIKLKLVLFSSTVWLCFIKSVDSAAQFAAGGVERRQ